MRFIIWISLMIFLGTVFNGCGEKKERKSSAVSDARKPKISPQKSRIHTFRIRDVDHRSTTLEFHPDHVVFRRIRQPIVVLTFLSDWCPPCRGLLPYLGRLQKNNSRDLFVIGILVNSDLNDTRLRRFMTRYESNFFISNHPDNDLLGYFVAAKHRLGTNYPLPLTLLYKNGKYKMHISGAVPYEMLQNLIDQLRKED